MVTWRPWLALLRSTITTERVSRAILCCGLIHNSGRFKQAAPYIAGEFKLPRSSFFFLTCVGSNTRNQRHLIRFIQHCCFSVWTTFEVEGRRHPGQPMPGSCCPISGWVTAVIRALWGLVFCFRHDDPEHQQTAGVTLKKKKTFYFSDSATQIFMRRWWRQAESEAGF